MPCFTEKKDGPAEHHRLDASVRRERRPRLHVDRQFLALEYRRPRRPPIAERLKKNGCGTDALSAVGVFFEKRVTPTPTPILRHTSAPAEMLNAGPDFTS